MNISLIGPRGSGKSKISRRLTRLTGKAVVSTDMIAVYETGLSIPELVKKHNGNWKFFRNLELSILKKLRQANDIIIDCGGGIIFDVDENNQEFFSEEKAQLLKSMSTVISLSRPGEYLIRKIKNDPSRPPLSQIQSYESILKFRQPYYEQVADFSLLIEHMTPNQASEKIYSFLIEQKSHH